MGWAYHPEQMQAYGERCYQAGRAAAHQGAQVPQWQPIETAPDRTPFHALVACPLDGGGHFVEEAWWDYTRREWWPANTDYTDSHGSPLHPSHWMPLPAPPSASPQAPAAQPHQTVACIGGNPSCPCQDGDACHYKEAADGTKAMPIPPHAPLSFDQLQRVMSQHFGGRELSDDEADSAEAFARAIERAHGITARAATGEKT
jgi:hypothetical protein